jgi:hypothetical protein
MVETVKKDYKENPSCNCESGFMQILIVTIVSIFEQEADKPG